MVNKRISRNKKTKHTGGSSPKSLKSLKRELEIEMTKIAKPPYSTVRNASLYTFQGANSMFGPNPDLGTDPESKALAQRIVALKKLIEAEHKRRSVSNAKVLKEVNMSIAKREAEEAEEAAKEAEYAAEVAKAIKKKLGTVLGLNKKTRKKSKKTKKAKKAKKAKRSKK
jgi:hypothetical protein